MVESREYAVFLIAELTVVIGAAEIVDLDFEARLLVELSDGQVAARIAGLKLGEEVVGRMVEAPAFGGIELGGTRTCEDRGEGASGESEALAVVAVGVGHRRVTQA